MNSGGNRQILSAIIGGTGFCLFYLLFTFSLPVALILAAGMYGATVLITTPPRGRINYQGLSQEYVKELVAKGQAKIDQMRTLAKKIPKEQVKSKVLQMCTTGEKIINDFQKDGNDTAVVRRFLINYLDSTVQILTRYTEIIERGVKGKDAADACTRVEQMLDKMQKAWEQLHSKSFATELMNLETELSVVEKTIISENTNES